MAHQGVKHDYHIINPSPWPLMGSASAVCWALGLVMGLRGLFAQTRNLFRPRFLSLLLDIVRFYREAPRDLAARSRLGAVAAGLADLGIVPPQAEGGSVATVGDHAALGWLFVSEGSTLGAAILLKRAEALGLSDTFGARYLAAAPEGRARHWKAFVEALDGLDLTPAQDAEVTAGADAAFRRFAALITREFAL